MTNTKFKKKKQQFYILQTKQQKSFHSHGCDHILKAKPCIGVV